MRVSKHIILKIHALQFDEIINLLSKSESFINYFVSKCVDSTICRINQRCFKLKINFTIVKSKF